MRSMVTSALGYIQQRISIDCLQMIKQLDSSFGSSVSDYNLFGAWKAIGNSMSPKGIAKSLSTARILCEACSMKQGTNESITVYSSRFTKKIEELITKDEVEISESVIASIYIYGLNEAYNGYKNHIQNRKGNTIDLISVREGAIRWAVTVSDIGLNNDVVVAAFSSSSNNKNSSSLKSSNRNNNSSGKQNKLLNKRTCFRCGQVGHLLRDCSIKLNNKNNNNNFKKFGNNKIHQNKNIATAALTTMNSGSTTSNAGYNTDEDNDNDEESST